MITEAIRSRAKTMLNGVGIKNEQSRESLREAMWQWAWKVKERLGLPDLQDVYERNNRKFPANAEDQRCLDILQAAKAWEIKRNSGIGMTLPRLTPRRSPMADFFDLYATRDDFFFSRLEEDIVFVKRTAFKNK